MRKPACGLFYLSQITTDKSNTESIAIAVPDVRPYQALQASNPASQGVQPMKGAKVLVTRSTALNSLKL